VALRTAALRRQQPRTKFSSASFERREPDACGTGWLDTIAKKQAHETHPACPNATTQAGQQAVDNLARRHDNPSGRSRKPPMFGSAIAMPQRQKFAANLYTNVSVDGAASDRSGHELVSLLFDGLLGAMARARGAMQQGDIEQKSRAIDNALRIIGEGLRAGLNLKDGGPLARDLNDLYGYIEHRLTLANLRNDSQSLVECSELVKTLADAWREIGPQVRQAG
jgi:flagellar protein FliS